jgi:uncharacterized circularly permuted ATP-grasp superfamily protein
MHLLSLLHGQVRCLLKFLSTGLVNIRVRYDSLFVLLRGGVLSSTTLERSLILVLLGVFVVAPKDLSVLRVETYLHIDCVESIQTLLC